MNNNEEVIIKAIGKLTLELDLDWDQQKKVKNVLEDILYGYNVQTLEKSLVKSDMGEKIFYYLKVKELEGCSKKTLRNAMCYLLKFSEWINKPVATITKNDIRMFLIATTADAKPSTKNTITYIIKGFFTWLSEEEIIPKNPAGKLPVNKLPKRLRGYLKIDELERLRIACETDRERCLIEFLFATGCRVEEVSKVNIEDVNFNDNTVRIIGKGNKERIVCFSAKTKVYIQKYLESRIDNNPALFVSKIKPYNRLGVRGIQYTVHGIADKAGFEKSVYPHLLRHTMATLSQQAGADITTIQHLLGHSSPATTQIYAEQDMDNIKHEYKQHFIQ